MKLNKLISKKCPFCFQSYHGNEPLCEDCRNEIKKYSYGNRCIKCGRLIDDNEKLCIHCQRLQPHFMLAFAVFPYKGNFKEAIKRAKFYNEYFLVKSMSELMTQEFLKMKLQADCIIYVPTDIKTNYERKYCLSQELAYSAGRKLKLKIYKDFLIKKFNAEKQSLVKLEKRYTNIKNIFRKNPFTLKNVKGKNVLLIDDVLTTGSTLSECARILKEHGANEVYGAALSYGASDIF